VKAVRSRSYLSFVWLARHRSTVEQHSRHYNTIRFSFGNLAWKEAAFGGFGGMAGAVSLGPLSGMREGPDFFSGTQPSASWVAASEVAHI
jgi:hypothetical protein